MFKAMFVPEDGKHIAGCTCSAAELLTNLRLLYLTTMHSWQVTFGLWKRQCYDFMTSLYVVSLLFVSNYVTYQIEENKYINLHFFVFCLIHGQISWSLVLWLYCNMLISTVILLFWVTYHEFPSNSDPLSTCFWLVT